MTVVELAIDVADAEVLLLPVGCLGGSSISSLLQMDRSSPFLLSAQSIRKGRDIPEITFLVGVVGNVGPQGIVQCVWSF